MDWILIIEQCIRNLWCFLSIRRFLKVAFFFFSSKDRIKLDIYKKNT